MLLGGWWIASALAAPGIRCFAVADLLKEAPASGADPLGRSEGRLTIGWFGPSISVANARLERRDQIAGALLGCPQG